MRVVSLRIPTWRDQQRRRARRALAEAVASWVTFIALLAAGMLAGLYVLPRLMAYWIAG